MEADVARRVFGAALMAALLVGLVPTVVAAGSGTTFDLRMNDTCIQGATYAAPFRILWKGANGAVKGDETFEQTGGWQICTNGRRLTAGDLLKVSNGDEVRKFTVPPLSIAIDRVNNVVSGTARPGTVVHLDHPYVADVPVDPAGHWSYAPNGDFNGNNVFQIHWSSAHGDRINLVQFAPQLFLTIGKSRFQVFGTPNSDATMTLTRETASGQRAA